MSRRVEGLGTLVRFELHARHGLARGHVDAALTLRRALVDVRRGFRR
jgi:hypothetical protein